MWKWLLQLEEFTRPHTGSVGRESGGAVLFYYVDTSVSKMYIR